MEITKEQIELWRNNHSGMSHLSDEIIMECIEFEEVNGPMTEMYSKGQVWKAELVELKKDIIKEVEENMKVFKEWVVKTFPIGCRVSFLGREMYVYDLWEPTVKWSDQHDFSVICAWWDGNMVQKIRLSRKEVGDGIPYGNSPQVCRLLFPLYLNDKVEKLKEERKRKLYCYGE